MKLYVDSADISIIASFFKTGAFRGVTTNPLILKAANIGVSELPEFARGLFDHGVEEMFLQSWGKDAAELHERGLRLAAISGKVVVKLPATRHGIEAASRLSKEGVRLCLTAVFAPFQAILAASIGAAYVAPYLGRMNDAGLDGHALIAEMAEALRPPGCAVAPLPPAQPASPAAVQPEILAASIRHSDDLVKLARSGVPCATLSPAVAATLFTHPLTEAATLAFETAAGDLSP